MPRVEFVVDQNDHAKQIIEDLIKQVPYSTIGRKYGVTVESLRNYASQKLQPAIAHQQLIDLKSSHDFYITQTQKNMSYVSKLLDACNEWLTDPAHPDRYTLKDRAEELTLCYTTQEPTGREDKWGVPIMKTVRHSENLQTMIDKALEPQEDKEPEVLYVHSARTDNRKLLLDAVKTMESSLELMARITGDMKDITVNVDMNGVVIPGIVQIVLESTRECPEVGERMVQGLNDLLLTQNAGLLK